MNKKNYKENYPPQEEVIDSILTRHIKIIKFSNYAANSIIKEFDGFRNELVADFLLDVRDSPYFTSVNRLDRFLEKMHIKFSQLIQRIETSIEENADIIFSSELSFLDSFFKTLPYKKRKIHQYDLFGVDYKEHLRGILNSLKKDITSNYKISISYNHPDSYLLSKFRGTPQFSYKDSIFTNYRNKLRTLFKNIFISHSSETRFYFFIHNSHVFNYYAEAIPFEEPPTKKKKDSLGVYSTSDFSPQKNSKPWKGVLIHFNSPLTQIPFYNLDNFAKFNLRDWFRQKSDSFKKEILGKKRFNLYKNKDYSYSQIFDSSGSRTSNNSIKSN